MPLVTLQELQRNLERMKQVLNTAAQASTAAPAPVAALSRGPGRQQVQAMLSVSAVAEPVRAALQELMSLAVATADTAKQLIAGAAAPAATGDDAEPVQRVNLWQQLLSTEQGRQLPGCLMRFGRLLSAALPARCCCNEPSCSCFDKASELQLAGGKGSKCSGCGVARYCGVLDQRKHWKVHKAVCRAIAGAATGKSNDNTS